MSRIHPVAAVGIGAGAALAAGLALAACGTAPPMAATVAAATPPPAPSPTASCLGNVNAWRTTGLPVIEAVSRDLGRASKSTGSLGAMQGAVTKLSADSSVLLADLPPACVPGMRQDAATALHDFIAASNSVNQGDMGSLQFALQQIDAGSAAIVRATTDLNNWENSGAQ
jgi:hypothetical protein